MKILVFHGYMLRGTGSNIYNANLARALAAAGHEVHLLCQDRSVEIEGVRIHNPDIGGLLPVYVKDPYEGFEVKTFSELSEDELHLYIEANVLAVREVAAAAGGIDLALANHLVMGPVILARAGVAPYAAKIHGSALEYTVKPDLDRFGPYAEEGVAAANGVLVGSRHTAESLWRALPGMAPELEAKTRLGPPGVDTEEFRPGGEERDPMVVYVGKLIVSKGVDLLIAAWPLVLAEDPEAQLRIAGYGEYEDGLWQLLGALERGDLEAARAVALAGRGLEGGEEEPLEILSGFLADPPPGYLDAARGLTGSIQFVGRLEHDQVAGLLPHAEALVMPSTFPESFGMVAVEAAASGALPVSADHSGMREVSRQLSAALPPAVGDLTSFPVEPGAVEAIAARLNGWFSLSPVEREAARETIVETTRRLWSWDGVARGVIAAAGGELDRLPLA
jgi:glycosyltransferase involved in cell wall biosynthesis